MITIRFGPPPGKRDISADQSPTGSGPFYVYVHRDQTGRIFYIGKGTGQRAWKGDRHSVWHRYVQERSGGIHTIQIVSYHATTEEAEREEDELISQYGDQLVNWINPGRQFDYPAIKRFHELRNANRILLDEAKRMESTDLAGAIELYQRAMLAMYEYEAIVHERGLVAELSDFGRFQGETQILNRLTLCLHRSGRFVQLETAINNYLSRFPRTDLESPKMRSVMKRLNRVRV